MDLITSLPFMDHGLTAIIVLVDRLSKMAHFVLAVNEVSAVDCAQLFRHHVLRLHGCPRNVVSNRDPRITISFFAEFCGLAGIEKQLFILSLMARWSVSIECRRTCCATL